MSKPQLAVCLITYNQVKYIKEAIDSVLAQETNFDWELVIADDYSTDGTREIIEDYKRQFPDRIKLILQKKNVGAERNWLDLINYPKSKYIAYLEGDDYWTDENKLQQQVDFLEKNDKYALCFHPTRVFFEKGEERQTIWPHIQDKSKVTLETLLQENFIPSHSVVYRRQDYSKIPLGVIPGDWFLHLYHAQFGEIGYINKVMSVYRRHSNGLWWSAYSDKDKQVAKYGTQNAALYFELLKIFGKEPRHREILYRSLAKTMDDIIAVDERLSTNVTTDVIKMGVDRTEVLLHSFHQRATEDQARINDEQAEIERLNDDIIGLRGEQFKLRDELHTLKNSRVIGRIIKTRESIGETIPKIKRLPRRILHKIKVTISGMLPEVLKKVLRRIRHYKHQAINYYHQRQMVIETVANRKWKPGQPLVSVVVPYYNLAHTVDETLQSLDNQTFRDFEVIIVDDGSPDPESVEKFKEIKQSGFKAKFIRQDNQGVAAARNNGISHARGKYIVCLDSDDIIEPTFIEKCTLVLETNPNVSLVTTNRTDFGIMDEVTTYSPYSAPHLLSDNMVITAAQFRAEAWKTVGGYRPAIGYEDWDYWLALAEHGYWGKTIPENLFRYRVAMQSRYVGDKDTHWKNIKTIHSLHPDYKKNIKKLQAQRQYKKSVTDPSTAFVNLQDTKQYARLDAYRPNVLITVPWMTFGGAETLIYNYCREINDRFNISFVTGLNSEHEWEYKFKEITPYVYHLHNLFGEDKDLRLEFLSNYITTRNIDILNIIHNGFTFEFLEELKKRHPKLKVVVTMFNDRVEYFEQSIGYEDYIDSFVSDNGRVTKHYQEKLTKDVPAVVIPNGINCFEEFNPDNFDRSKKRKELGLDNDELAVFFVGRLSVEKNPNVFVDVADKLMKAKKHRVKFFIIGDGPMRSDIEEQIAELKPSNLTYLGYQAEVASFLSAADVFVLPSSIEGFPLSILEALAMRVVVVASDVGAIAEVIDNGTDGFVVTPGSSAEIAESVKTLSEDKKVLNDMKNRSRKKAVDLYSNKTLGKNYANLYEGLLN